MEAFNEPLSAQTSLPAATKWLCDNKSTEVTARPGSCFHPPGLFPVWICRGCSAAHQKVSLQTHKTLPGLTTAGGQCQGCPSKNTEGTAGLWGSHRSVPPPPWQLGKLSLAMLSPGPWGILHSLGQQGKATRREQKSKCFAPE